MKYLGIDFGSKRVGLATSDESLSYAFPLKVVENSPSTINDICEICKELEITDIVVGESLNYKMEENEIMKAVKIFVSDLQEKSGLPIYMHPEFLTSAEAEHVNHRRMPAGSRLSEREMKNDMLDASAAAIILKSYLDLKNSNKIKKYNGK